MYWDATSSFLGINNLLFQIPILVKLENDEKYKNLINNADELFEVNNFEASLKLYNSAHALKNEEPYPVQQIKKIEPILIEIRIKELVKIANDKNTKISNNEIFIQNKDNYKKCKQLSKSINISYELYKSDLLLPFNKLIYLLENEEYTNVSIENIESYIEVLNRIILFQEKARKLSTYDDLSILQKDLKKLTEPKEIIDRILEGVN